MLIFQNQYNSKLAHPGRNPLITIWRCSLPGKCDRDHVGAGNHSARRFMGTAGPDLLVATCLRHLTCSWIEARMVSRDSSATLAGALSTATLSVGALSVDLLSAGCTLIFL